MRTKAAENRSLVLPMVDLCNAYNSGSSRDAARLKAAVCLARVQSVFNEAGTFLSAAEHERAMESMWSFCRFYHQLNLDASNRDSTSWHIVNKHHMFVHLCMSSRYLNPNLLWTYGYEDLVGRMKRIAVASKAGLQGRFLSKTIFLKYRNVLHFALQHSEQSL